MLRFALYLFVFISVLAGGLASAHAERRVALVIGNSTYEFAAPLKNPKNDAQALSAVLKKVGFEVVTGIDLAHLDFARTVATFRKKLKDADVGLFFYAGHGLQVDGRNYLLPVDAELEDEVSLDFETVTLKAILRLMEREDRVNLVFLDSCRDNPLARNLAKGMGTRSSAVRKGMARVETGIGTMIAFATQPGNVSLDGKGQHSPFTKALLHHIETPGLDIADLMRQVRRDVLAETQRRQVPWNHSSLTGSFLFKRGFAGSTESPENKANSTAAGALSQQSVATAYGATEKIGNCTAYKAFEESYPASFYARLARAWQLKNCVDQNGHAAAESKTASLQPNAQMSAEPEVQEQAQGPQDEGPGSRALALAIQKQLVRLGCSPGQPDGVWGRNSRRALGAFAKHGKVKLASLEPSNGALDALTTRKSRVCPLHCGPGKKLEQGNCITDSQKKDPGSPRLNGKWVMSAKGNSYCRRQKFRPTVANVSSNKISWRNGRGDSRVGYLSGPGRFHGTGKAARGGTLHFSVRLKGSSGSGSWYVRGGKCKGSMAFRKR